MVIILPVNLESMLRWLAVRYLFRFHSAVANKSEGVTEGVLSSDGCNKHHFWALDTISVVLIKVKKILATRTKGLNIKGQILAEPASMSSSLHLLDLY